MKKIFVAGFLSLCVYSGFAQQTDTIKTRDIDEVTVKASRTDANIKNIPQKVEIIDQKLIISVPNENMAELLKRTTNIDIIQYPGMSAMAGMRGFSPSAVSRSYTMILINGMPSGTDNLASINTDMIERIEVIKGSSSMLYGSDAMGGIINIITKEVSDKKSGMAGVSIGSFGNLKLNANVSGPISKKTKFSLGISRQEQQKDYRIGSGNLLNMSNAEKLILDKASYGDVMKNSQYQIHNLDGQIIHSFNDIWSATVTALYTFANDVEVPGNYWGSYGQSKKDVDRINVYTSVKRSYKNNTLTLSPYFTDEKNPNYSDNSDSSYITFRSKVKEYGFKINDNQTFGKFKLLVGADMDVYDYSSVRYSQKATATNPFNPNNKNIKTALLAQLSYSTDRLDINAGARCSYITYKTDENASLKGTGGTDHYKVATPSVGAQYILLKGLKAHASFGTAFSVPDAFKMAGNYSISEYFAAWDYWYVKNYKGNPDLKPEHSATGDFGLHYTLPKKLLDVDVTYFKTKHDDKIIEYTVGDTTSFKNANNSKMDGLELMISSDLSSLFDNNCKLEIYASFTQMFHNTVNETLISTLGKDSTVTRDLQYARKNNGTFGIYFENNNGFSTRLNARYIGSRLERDNFGTLRPGITSADYYTGGGYTAKDMILKHPDYLLFDYSMFYKIEAYRFGVTISNVFDENYSEKDGYNMPGRMVTGSLSYLF